MSLIEDLKKEKSKLEIYQEYGIRSVRCEYGDKFEISVIFVHDKGELEYGRNLPTYREKYGFDDEDFEKLSYKKKKKVSRVWILILMKRLILNVLIEFDEGW